MPVSNTGGATNQWESGNEQVNEQVAEIVEQPLDDEPFREVNPTVVRQWAKKHGVVVSSSGRIKQSVLDMYHESMGKK